MGNVRILQLVSIFHLLRGGCGCWSFLHLSAIVYTCSCPTHIGYRAYCSPSQGSPFSGATEAPQNTILEAHSKSL